MNLFRYENFETRLQNSLLKFFNILKTEIYSYNRTSFDEKDTNFQPRPEKSSVLSRQ